MSAAVEPEDQAKELDAWLDGLRGIAAGDDREAAAGREGQCLRAALRSTGQEFAMPSLPTADELLAHAEAAGLFSAAGNCAWCARLRNLLRPPAWPSLGLVGAALVALTLWVRQPEELSPVPFPMPVPEPGGQMRGDGVPLLLQQQEPAQWRDELAQDLRAHGIEVLTYERLGRYGLDADLGSAASPALQALLKQRGLSWPGGGELRLEVQGQRQ